MNKIAVVLCFEDSEHQHEVLELAEKLASLVEHTPWKASVMGVKTGTVLSTDKMQLVEIDRA